MVLSEFEYKDESGNGLFLQTKRGLDRQNIGNKLYEEGIARLVANNRVLRVTRAQVWQLIPGGHDGMLRHVIEKKFNRGYKELSFKTFQ